MKEKEFWIKKINPYFEELDEVPLFKGEKLHLSNFSNLLKNKLNIESLKVSSKTIGWQSEEDIKNSFQDKISQHCLIFTPLLGNVYFITDQKEIESLTSSIMKMDNTKNFPALPLKEGFFRYILLLSLDLLKKTKTFHGLTPKIVERAEIKSKEAFCLNISISIDETTTFNGKIAITQDFRRSWNEFFNLKKSIIFDESLKSTEVPLSLVASFCHLSKEELSSIKKGDFILLEKSTFDPEADSNKITIAFNEKPIFHAKLLNNKIHILDFANYYEDNETMENYNEENRPSSSEEEIATTTVNEEITSLNEVEVKLTVELAKIQMTLEKLTNLQPGNYLQMPISLEDPVSLTLNGNKIATGELIKLEDKLGIRILQIG